MFTRDVGRVNVKVKNLAICERLWPGMVVSCSLIKEKHKYYAENVALLELQGVGNHASLKLLHHIFELCYYFVPLESPSVEIYRFLHYMTHFFCLQSLFCDEWVTIERICIAKFLSMLGFYDSGTIRESLRTFEELTLLSVDFTHKQKVEFLKKKIVTINTKELDEWILRYLKSHPSFSSFKTVVFHYS